MLNILRSCLSILLLCYHGLSSFSSFLSQSSFFNFFLWSCTKLAIHHNSGIFNNDKLDSDITCQLVLGYSGLFYCAYLNVHNTTSFKEVNQENQLVTNFCPLLDSELKLRLFQWFILNSLEDFSKNYSFFLDQVYISKWAVSM